MILGCTMVYWGALLVCVPPPLPVFPLQGAQEHVLTQGELTEITGYAGGTPQTGSNWINFWRDRR